MGVSLPVQSTALLPHNAHETRFTVMEGVACRATSEYNATCTECCAAGPYQTKHRTCSDDAACQGAYGLNATCTECCAVDPQWAAQWMNWRCPERCWLSAWLHTVPQCPQASSCIQGYTVCSIYLTGKLQVPAQTALETHDLPCTYLAHQGPESVCIMLLSECYHLFLLQVLSGIDSALDDQLHWHPQHLNFMLSEQFYTHFYLVVNERLKAES